MDEEVVRRILRGSHKRILHHKHNRTIARLKINTINTILYMLKKHEILLPTIFFIDIVVLFVFFCSNQRKFSCPFTQCIVLHFWALGKANLIPEKYFFSVLKSFS